MSFIIYGCWKTKNWCFVVKTKLKILFIFEFFFSFLLFLSLSAQVSDINHNFIYGFRFGNYFGSVNNNSHLNDKLSWNYLKLILNVYYCYLISFSDFFNCLCTLFCLFIWFFDFALFMFKQFCLSYCVGFCTGSVTCFVG